MSFKVTIRQHDGTVPVAQGETILQAALVQGIAYPHGCQSGNCGACKSRLLAGEVDLMPYSDYALTAEERASGLILACRAMPSTDCAVAWLELDELVSHPLRRLACRVERIESATHDIRQLFLRIESGGPFAFSAGQYARLAFADQPARDYSMANRPDQALLEFHIRRMAGGTVSAYAADRLAIGDEVGVEGPFGTAYLRNSHAGPILALAGGSGLAPVKSIVETALRRGGGRPIHLYFGGRDERDLYLLDHFAALARQHANFRFTPVLSDSASPSARRIGLVHEAALADRADLDGFKAYLAGPPAMVEAATAALAARGLAAHDIHADAFYTEAEKASLGIDA